MNAELKGFLNGGEIIAVEVTPGKMTFTRYDDVEHVVVPVGGSFSAEDARLEAADLIAHVFGIADGVRGPALRKIMTDPFFALTAKKVRGSAPVALAITVNHIVA